MKKYFSFALMALMAGLVLCSCKATTNDDEDDEAPTKEAQFMEDLTDFVKDFEAIPSDADETEFQKWVESAEKRFKDYELSLDDIGRILEGDYDDALADAKLELSKKQIKKLEDLRERYEKKAEEVKEEAQKKMGYESRYDEYDDMVDSAVAAVDYEAAAPVEEAYDY